MDKKEPMIDPENRPTAIDYDAPIADWKIRDILAVIRSELAEQQRYIPVPEEIKPEYYKPEKELGKAEKEALKPEKELLKPEKERMKPESYKPEKEFDIPDLVESVATRVVEMLEERGLFRRK